jgi:type I restriction enzyme S subunit
MNDLVPEGWKQLEVQKAFIIGRGRVISKPEIKNNQGIYPVFSSQSKNNGKMGAIGTFDFDGEYITWTTDGAYAGTVFHRNGKFNCTNVCGTLKDNGSYDIFPRFVASYLSTVAKKHVSYVGNPKLMNGTFAEIEFLLPPLPEQQKIAAILSSVDEVVEKTQAQIDKLKNLKTGMMQELLTKGIGHTEFKDSPVGMIPVEWDVCTANDVSQGIMVGVVIKPTQYYVESGVPALRSANVRLDGLTLSNLKYFSIESNEKLKKSKLQLGDLLTVRTGYPGTTAVVTKEFVGTNCIDVVITRPSSRIDSNFLSMWVNSDNGKGQVLKAQGGLAQQHFNVGDMRNLLVALPPLVEQLEIFNVVDSVTNKIKITEKKLEANVNTKKALMQDLLTGKVRVTLN